MPHCSQCNIIQHKFSYEQLQVLVFDEYRCLLEVAGVRDARLRDYDKTTRPRRQASVWTRVERGCCQKSPDAAASAISLQSMAGAKKICLSCSTQQFNRIFMIQMKFIALDDKMLNYRIHILTENALVLYLSVMITITGKCHLAKNNIFSIIIFNNRVILPLNS